MERNSFKYIRGFVWLSTQQRFLFFFLNNTDIQSSETWCCCSPQTHEWIFILEEGKCQTKLKQTVVWTPKWKGIYIIKPCHWKSCTQCIFILLGAQIGIEWRRTEAAISFSTIECLILSWAAPSPISYRRLSQICTREHCPFVHALLQLASATLLWIKEQLL